LEKRAKLSDCRSYRFALWRIWDESMGNAMFIGLNPSTADEIVDDPTIVRCINFAKSWGYGGLSMANLFAFRATNPDDMFNAIDPIGPDNDEWLVRLAKASDIVIAAWGNDGSYLGRSIEVKKLKLNFHYLKMNISGEPAHPLYLDSSLKPKPMRI